MKKITLLLVLIVPTLLMAQVNANIPDPQIKCDINNPGDMVEIFDLTASIPQIIGGQTNVVVTFHPTSGDALGNGGVFPNPDMYENEVNPQTVFVRVENVNNSNDFAVTTLEIEVRVAPVPVNPNPDPIEVADADGDGFASFDLTLIEDQIVDDPFVVDVTYFESLSDAQSNVNVIADPTDYTNIVATIQTVYARMQNAPEEECVTIVPFEIVANPNLGVEDITITNFTLSPNPASESVRISGTTPFESVTVYNILGSKITQKNGISGTTTTLDITSLNRGVYFVMIDNRTSIKLIKN